MGQHHTGEQRTSLPSAETAAGNNLPPGNLCLRSGILMLSEALLGENTETFTIFFFFFFASHFVLFLVGKHLQFVLGPQEEKIDSHPSGIPMLVLG